MIKKDVSQAHVGNFVIASGQLMLLDLAMLRSAWDKPVIQTLMKAGQREHKNQANQNREARRATAKQPVAAQVNEFDVFIALLSMLPHALQARLIGDAVNIWCTLEETSVIGRASDLVLKHGALLDGTWNVLGVLDATPYDPNYKNEQGEAAEDILARVAETMVGQLAARLAPATRNILGRPPSAYGVTPVLIFRDVSGSGRPSD